MHFPIIGSQAERQVGEDDASHDLAIFYVAYLSLMIGAGGAMLLLSSFVAFGR